MRGRDVGRTNVERRTLNIEWGMEKNGGLAQSHKDAEIGNAREWLGMGCEFDRVGELTGEAGRTLNIER